MKQRIGEETQAESAPQIPNIEPWPEQVVEQVYRRMGRDWEAIEDAAARAQRKADWND